MLRKEHIRSERDEVDRASYIDSTLQIKRFISEGRNLAEYRARALRNGMYINADSVLKESSGTEPVVPVYDTDPAILAPVIKASMSELETRRNDRVNESLAVVTNGDNAPELAEVTSPAVAE